MALTGTPERIREHRRTYMREYRARTSPRKRDMVETVQRALGVRARGKPRKLALEAVTEGQAVLRAVLRATGIDISTVATKIKAQLEAERPFGKDAIMSADNDAQLRACDLSLKLHERAGTIPAAAEGHHGGISITVVEVHYGSEAPRDVVVEGELSHE
jgi:hypothetical protein